jgi:hypothetical protein
VIIRKNADLVELKQLGFDPLDPPSIRSDDQEKEDAFARTAEKLAVNGGGVRRGVLMCIFWTGMIRNCRLHK